MFYRIAAVNELTGEPAEDQRAQARVGREGRLVQLEQGRPMMIYYEEPYAGQVLTTSTVQKVTRKGEELRVVTRNHVYILKSLEG